MDKKQERLQTERLLLKAMDTCDQQQMVDIFFDENIKKTYMLPDFENPKQAGELFERIMHFSRADNHFVYGIYRNDTLIGFVNDCEIKDSSIEIGYLIATAHQRNGYATEAVQACVEELFRMGFEQVTAGFFEENIASCRVMQKCGMRKLDLEEDIEYKGILRHCIYYGIEKTRVL